jgi:hypothetical protein
VSRSGLESNHRSPPEGGISGESYFDSLPPLPSADRDALGIEQTASGCIEPAQGDRSTFSSQSIASFTANGPLCFGPLGPLVREGPRVALDEAAIARLEQRWGADSDGAFSCPIPGHSKLARLALRDGEFLLACCQGPERSLGEVRAAEAYGQDERRKNIEIATWYRRLAYELGGFPPVGVKLPPLPAAVPPYVERARRGFELLAGLRWADYQPRALPFAVRFCAAWCDLSHHQASQALLCLRESGVLREAELQGKLRLYLPGVVSSDQHGESAQRAQGGRTSSSRAHQRSARSLPSNRSVPMLPAAMGTGC